MSNEDENLDGAAFDDLVAAISRVDIRGDVSASSAPDVELARALGQMADEHRSSQSQPSREDPTTATGGRSPSHAHAPVVEEPAARTVSTPVGRSGGRDGGCGEERGDDGGTLATAASAATAEAGAVEEEGCADLPKPRPKLVVRYKRENVTPATTPDKVFPEAGSSGGVDSSSSAAPASASASASAAAGSSSSSSSSHASVAFVKTEEDEEEEVAAAVEEVPSPPPPPPRSPPASADAFSAPPMTVTTAGSVSSPPPQALAADEAASSSVAAPDFLPQPHQLHAHAAPSGRAHRPRVEECKPDKVHPTPQRKPRSKRDSHPPPAAGRASAFAAFREAKREEAKETAEYTAEAAAAAAEALAGDLRDKVALTSAAAEAEAEAGEQKKRGGARSMRDGGAVGVVGLVYSDIMELHEGPPQHFERPARHAAVVAKIQKDGLERRCEAIAARLADDDELLTCHTREHIDAVESTFDASSPEAVQGLGDIFWTEHTARCARLATGSACEAAAAVAAGTVHRALAVVRPPGHHAECQRAMGFCFYNNTAVAARTALRQPGVERVLLLDWDVHHGNGIQDILYDDPAVMYVSLHRYGNDFYPGTGAVSEVGRGPGSGFNVNVPWEEKALGGAGAPRGDCGWGGVGGVSPWSPGFYQMCLLCVCQ